MRPDFSRFMDIADESLIVNRRTSLGRGGTQACLFPLQRAMLSFIPVSASDDHSHHRTVALGCNRFGSLCRKRTHRFTHIQIVGHILGHLQRRGADALRTQCESVMHVEPIDCQPERVLHPKIVQSRLKLSRQAPVADADGFGQQANMAAPWQTPKTFL